MLGDQSDDRRRFLTILDNILTVDGQLGVKSELTCLNINQEELEGVRKTARQRISPRRSSGSMSAAKNISTSPGPTLKKIIINMTLSITVLFLLMFSGN